MLEFRTDASEKVFPMVPSGQTNDDIVVDPTQGERGDDAQSMTPAVAAEAAQAPRAVGAGGEQGRRARARRRACSPGVATTSTRSPSRRPTTSASAASPIVVDVETAPLEQIVKQLNKLINVIKIVRAGPAGDSIERELHAGHGQGRRRRCAARSSSSSASSTAGSSTSATTS
ncbi:MAG: hypothetical protein V9E94_17475 [Microthrixaceae bacterium]